MKSTEPTDAKRHPIRIAARRSGLSADVIRAWEKRYSVVRPDRMGRGRRLYSDRDIIRLRSLQQAVEAGRRIGDIASLSTPELEALVREDRNATPAPGGLGRSPGDDSQHPIVGACLSAVERLDGRQLKGTLDRAVVSLAPESLLEDVVSPLMRRIGELWWRGELTPSQEHVASAVVHVTLMEVINALAPRGPAPVLVVATPTGQRHEIGAMLAAAAGSTHGWSVLYLGADLPGADIGSAAREGGARAVALSIIHPPDDPRMGWELKLLRRTLGDGVPIFVGGQAAGSYSSILGEIDAVLLRDVRALGTALKEMARSSTAPSVERWDLGEDAIAIRRG